MPRIRYNWRQNLSQPRNTAQDMALQQQKIMALQNRAAQQDDPLQDQYRELQILRAQGDLLEKQNDIFLHTETQRQKNAYLATMPALDAALMKQGIMPGTTEYAQAMLAVREQIPHGASDKYVDEDLRRRTKVADVEAAFAQRKRELMPPPQETTAKYAQLKGDIPQFEAELKGDIERQKTANVEKKLPGVDYNPAFDAAAAKIAGSLEGSKVHKAQLEKDYPQLIQPAVTPATAQTSATPHPMEGQSVRNKQTGAMGVITNGQFIPVEEQQ